MDKSSEDKGLDYETQYRVWVALEKELQVLKFEFNEDIKQMNMKYSALKMKVKEAKVELEKSAKSYFEQKTE